MTEQEMRDWLMRGYYASRELCAITEEVCRARSRAQAVHVCYERVGAASRGGANTTERALVHLAEMEERCRDYITGLNNIIREVSAAIDALPLDVRAVMRCRYVCFLSVAKTAEALGWSTETVKKKTRQGIRQLCERGVPQ